MYGQIYTLPFQSIEENDYLVVIEKDGFAGTSTELTGSTSPFTVETSLDSPLYPYRLSTATLKIFGGDYLQNLFTPNPQGVRVKLLKNGSVEWIGFVTNDVYSQDYSSTEFEYEIELVNPLSTLKYKKFIDNDTGLISIYQLIIDSIKETNSIIRRLYLPNTITDTLNQNIYEIVSTSTSNYIDEQDEQMTYYEILEEIAKYLGLTISIYKDEVYFLDYVGIGKSYNTYYGYTINSNGTITKDSSINTLIDTNTIQLLDYAGDSSSLQINSGKNKAKVTCSLYDIEDLVPEFNDEKAKIFTDNHTMFFPKIYKNTPYTTIIRNYTHSEFDFYNYTFINNIATQNSGDTLTSGNKIGSNFVRTITYKDEEKPNSLRLDNEILIRTFIGSANDNNATDEQIIFSGTGVLKPTDPVFTVKSKRKFIFLNNTYFYLTFNYKMLLELGQIDKRWNTTRDTVITIPIKLKIGNYYYNGTSWTTTETKFNLELDKLYVKDGIFGEHRVSTYLLGEYIKVKNTNDYTIGIGEMDAYIINPPSTNIYGAVELTLYSNDSTLHSFDWSHLPGFKVTGKYNFIKDFKFGYAIPSDNIYNDYEDTKSDIIYENVIDTAYVDELESEVGLKICTFPEDYRKLTNSSTYTNEGSDVVLLKTLKYTPLTITDLPEKILINKSISYFKDPKFQLSIPINNKDIKPYTTITDSNLTGKKFIYAGNEIDYEYEKNTITLIEI